jgi:hypothetical protein
MKLRPDEIRKIFDYKDGNLVWRSQRSRARKGDVAGTPLNGYIVVRYNGIGYKAHRLVWAWHHGVWPNIVDHINGNPADNRIENLRSVTAGENALNATRSCKNTSGVKGVTWNKKDKVWRVSFRCGGRLTYFGGFKDFEFAELVAIEARQKYHGAFARME